MTLKSWKRFKGANDCRYNSISNHQTMFKEFWDIFVMPCEVVNNSLTRSKKLIRTNHWTGAVYHFLRHAATVMFFCGVRSNSLIYFCVSFSLIFYFVTCDPLLIADLRLTDSDYPFGIFKRFLSSLQKKHL
jgi:hypothetical protein